jgi:hypothetical protein
MIRFSLAIAFVGIIIGVTLPAIASNGPETCIRLARVIETGIQGLVGGNHTVRVLTALEAHRRLGCDPQELLDALKINRPKAIQGLKKKTK